MGIGLIVAGVILAIIGLFAVIAVAIGIAVYRRSRKEGVVYSDGIDKDEMEIIKEIMEEEVKAESTRVALGKIQAAVSKAITRQSQ